MLFNKSAGNRHGSGKNKSVKSNWCCFYLITCNCATLTFKSTKQLILNKVIQNSIKDDFMVFKTKMSNSF